MQEANRFCSWVPAREDSVIKMKSPMETIRYLVDKRTLRIALKQMSEAASAPLTRTQHFSYRMNSREMAERLVDQWQGGSPVRWDATLLSPTDDVPIWFGYQIDLFPVGHELSLNAIMSEWQFATRRGLVSWWGRWGEVVILSGSFTLTVAFPAVQLLTSQAWPIPEFAAGLWCGAWAVIMLNGLWRSICRARETSRHE